MLAHSTVPTLLSLLLLAFLFLIVIWKLAQRRVFLQLFREKRKVLSAIVFATTLLVAVVYLVLVIRNPGALPAVPKSLLTLLTAANALYLAGKTRTNFTTASPNLQAKGGSHETP